MIALNCIGTEIDIYSTNYLLMVDQHFVVEYLFALNVGDLLVFFFPKTFLFCNKESL